MWNAFFSMESFWAARRFVCVLVGIGLLGCTTGCLRRRMTITSNPPGATAYVDGHRLGRTPISTDFTYYGTRDIRLEMDNYQTLHVRQSVRPPWYELPPFDFFSETFTPGEVKDQHTYNYNMTPRTVASEEHILERAREMAEEGSRVVDSEGRIGQPVQREFVLPPQKSTPVTSAANPTLVPEPASVTSDPFSSPESSIPPAVTPIPNGTPAVVSPAPSGTMPAGSETWDTPPRYPSPAPY